MSSRRSSAHIEMIFGDSFIPSIAFTASSTPGFEVFTDILFTCSFIVRQLVNLGHRDPLALSIAENLQKYFTRSDLEQLARQPDMFSTGRPGASKYFTADLDVSTRRYIFTMHPKGFGLMSRGVNEYVAPSVDALFQYMSRRYEQDPNALTQLSEAVELCARLFREQKYGVRDQQSVAMTASLRATNEDGENDGVSEDEFLPHVQRVLEEFAAVPSDLSVPSPTKTYARSEFDRIRQALASQSYMWMSAMRPKPPLVPFHRALFALVRASHDAVGDALGTLGEAAQHNYRASEEYANNYRRMAMPEVKRRWQELIEELDMLRKDYPELDIDEYVTPEVIASMERFCSGTWANPLLDYQQLP